MARNPAFAEPYDRSIYWKTKDGQLLLLSEMEETHMRNIIAFFQRRHAPESVYEPIVKELEFRRFLNSTPDDPPDLI